MVYIILLICVACLNALQTQLNQISKNVTAVHTTNDGLATDNKQLDSDNRNLANDAETLQENSASISRGKNIVVFKLRLMWFITCDDIADSLEEIM